MFINGGKLILDTSMDAISESFTELLTSGADAEAARALGPLHERDIFGKHVMTFENVGRDKLEGLGELHTPSVADLFVAKVKGAAA